jgi:hypothetical protein
MALMYIDTHDERPPAPLPRPPRVSLRPLVPIGTGFALLGAAALVPPAAGYALVIASGALIARSLAKHIPSTNGLEDHRQ